MKLWPASVGERTGRSGESPSASSLDPDGGPASLSPSAARSVREGPQVDGSRVPAITNGLSVDRGVALGSAAPSSPSIGGPSGDGQAAHVDSPLYLSPPGLPNFSAGIRFGNGDAVLEDGRMLMACSGVAASRGKKSRYNQRQQNQVSSQSQHSAVKLTDFCIYPNNGALPAGVGVGVGRETHGDSDSMTATCLDVVSPPFASMANNPATASNASIFKFTSNAKASSTANIGKSNATMAVPTTFMGDLIHSVFHGGVDSAGPLHPYESNDDLRSNPDYSFTADNSHSISSGAVPATFVGELIDSVLHNDMSVTNSLVPHDIAEEYGSGDDDSSSTTNVPPQNNIHYPVDTDNDSIPWQPQSQTSTCEFTHTIASYSHKRDSGCKKAEYSQTTTDSHGNKWRLIIYVNGNGRASNHHLSLFLQVADAEDLPFGWNKAVSYVLTLEHPRGPQLGYAKRNPDKTFKMCPKAIDWGWSQFITSDRIQQEGYIQDDSLIVRASVTVKSSSVNIDPEDAELYLKCAVEEANPEAVRICLSQEASVNCQFKDDLYTPLHTACSANGAGNCVENSIGNGCTTISTNGGSPCPISPESLEVLQLLLEQGADVNACNKWRETPLLIAANNGNIEAVKSLLKNGADPSLCSEAGWSALTFAAHKGYDEIVGLLLAAHAPVNCRVTEDLSTPLHKACAGNKPGHLSAVHQLLEGDADVHALNKWRETPLLTAANHGQTEAVEALLDYGADPCKCTDTGWSPLSIAAYKGHDDVVRLLLEEGASTEEDDPTLSALLQAATKGLPDTVMLLLAHGADHTVTTKKGDTALAILVEQNLIDAAVEMVTDYNASIPRCSRDRKKVQRARLLINLRLKQMQRDGTGPYCDDSDEGESDIEPENGSTGALHDTSDRAISPSMALDLTKKKKGKKSGQKSIAKAEAEARAAEEALLLELEEEEKEKMAASENKSSKKKKKREKGKERLVKEAEKAKEEVVLEVKEKNEQSVVSSVSPEKTEVVVEITSDTINKVLANSNESTESSCDTSDLSAPPKPKLQNKKENPQPSHNKNPSQSKDAAKSKEVIKKKVPVKNKEVIPKQLKDVSMPSQSTESKSNVSKLKKSRENNSLSKRETTKKPSLVKANAYPSKIISGGSIVLKKVPGENLSKAILSETSNARKIPADNPVVKNLPTDYSNQQSSKMLPTTTQPKPSSPTRSKRGWESKAPASEHVVSQQKTRQQNSQQIMSQTVKETKKIYATEVTHTGMKPLSLSTQKDSFKESNKIKPRSDESTHSTANSTADSLPPTPTENVPPQRVAIAPSALRSTGGSSSVVDPFDTATNGVLGLLNFDSHLALQPISLQEYDMECSDRCEGFQTFSSARTSAITPPSSNQLPAISSPVATRTLLFTPPMTIELPSVSLFRLDKLHELFRICFEARSSTNNPLRVINEHLLRVVLYRWIIRASHGVEAFLDPVIPSWEDHEYLKEFLQRQFISESRRSLEDHRYKMNAPSIEDLRDAGIVLAELCLSLAKDVALFRLSCEQLVPPNWSDADINIAGVEEGCNVVIDWSGKSRLSIPFSLFNSMARRYVGEQNRLMAAVFSAVRRHEMIAAIADQTTMISHLPSNIVECFCKGLGVKLETWSDSVSVHDSNSFCAMFPDVDAAFGGLPFFAKEKGGGEFILNNTGGSVVVVTPPENSTASQCIRKVIDMVEGLKNVPLSFSIILSFDSFVNASPNLSVDDCRTLDPRLCGEQNSFISYVEEIPSGVSTFSKSSSLFLLIQNQLGQRHFPPHHAVINNIRYALRSDLRVLNEIPRSPTFAGIPMEPLFDSSQTLYPHQGNFFMSNPFGIGRSGGVSRGRRQRGRLFDLVGEEDVEEDQGMNILPGMLDNLSMNMFGSSNTNEDVDIEAISLMGIGLNGVLNSHNHH